MSNTTNTPSSTQRTWSISYQQTVYAIITVQNLTNHRFGITPEHLTWAMDIDTANGLDHLEVRVPRYRLRSRTVYDHTADNMHTHHGPGNVSAPDQLCVTANGRHIPVMTVHNTPISTPVTQSHHDLIPTVPNTPDLSPADSPAPTNEAEIATNLNPTVPNSITLPPTSPCVDNHTINHSNSLCPAVHTKKNDMHVDDEDYPTESELEEIYSNEYTNNDHFWSQFEMFDDEGEDNAYESDSWSLKRQYEVLGESWEDYLEH